jgi:hypothetical protein
MSNNLWQRLGAACGIVYVVLLNGGSSIGGPDIQAERLKRTVERSIRFPR